MVEQRLHVFSAFDTLPASYSSNRAFVECAFNEAMRVDERPVETSAFIVRLRQSEEQFARFGRARINREIQYFFVKELGAETARRRAHQICCGSNIHVSTTRGSRWLIFTISL